MKHPLSVTLILVLLFFSAQIVGLSLLSLNIVDVSDEGGARVVEHGATALGERPQTEGFSTVLYLLLGVAIGTALLLLLIKFKVFRLWKVWFLLAVWFSTTVAFGVLIPSTIALLVCLGLAVWKVYRPNPFIHNFTEVFMYAGIALIVAPLFHGSLLWVALLLVLISLYDMYAVWHSKHMIVMAQAQAESKLFAGLLVPRDIAGSGAPAKGATRVTTAAQAGKRGDAKGATKGDLPKPAGGSAILGGGDIAFPLIFSGVVMDWLIIGGATKTAALYQTVTITVTTTIALALLFYFAKRDRFYPAMPFISAGCFVGLGLVWLLQLL